MTSSPTAPAAYTSAAPATKNVLSIVAFVLSLVGFNVIAVVLGFVGLSQIKKTGQGGRGFAIAAIIIGLLSLVIGAILVAVTIGAAAQAGLEFE